MLGVVVNERYIRYIEFTVFSIFSAPDALKIKKRHYLFRSVVAFYMRVVPSFRPSVCLCVCPFVCPLAFKHICQKRRFQPARRILLPAGACLPYD